VAKAEIPKSARSGRVIVVATMPSRSAVNSAPIPPISKTHNPAQKMAPAETPATNVDQGIAALGLKGDLADYRPVR
jgi:hypothetical protein